MDAMYLNLMFINPRRPVGAGAKGARSTRPSLTPPCKNSWIRAWYMLACNGSVGCMKITIKQQANTKQMAKKIMVRKQEFDQNSPKNTAILSLSLLKTHSLTH